MGTTDLSVCKASSPLTCIQPNSIPDMARHPPRYPGVYGTFVRWRTATWYLLQVSATRLPMVGLVQEPPRTGVEMPKVRNVSYLVRGILLSSSMVIQDQRSQLLLDRIGSALYWSMEQGMLGPSAGGVGAIFKVTLGVMNGRMDEWTSTFYFGVRPRVMLV